MDQFNLGNSLNRFAKNTYTPLNTNNGQGGAPLRGAQGAGALNNQILNNQVSQNEAFKAGDFSKSNFTSLMNLKMNVLETTENSMYLKDLMKLPKDLKEVLALLQNNSSNTASAQEMAELLNSNLSMSTIAELLQKGGKEAMSKLVFAMAEASKQGMTDLSQLKDTIKLVNASVSAMSSENPNMILKNFMLLYLPWLPLREGVDFDLEIETSSEEGGEDETTLTIMLSTRNYGNIKIIITLKGINSFEILIICAENFPKEELLKRINTESKQHSLQPKVDFDIKQEKKEQKDSEEKPHQAKVSLSNLKDVNPFLLLLANALIKHTIDIDNLAD